MKENKYLPKYFYHAIPICKTGIRRNRFLKTLVLLGMVTSFLFVTGCGSGTTNTKIQSETTQENIDVDLTKLNSTMVYSEVYNMMTSPDDYKGKIIKVTGQFAVYHDDENNKDYFACLIADAATCCSQGLEFELEGEYTYPDDYPKVEEEVTLYGTFNTYEENGNTYCHLEKAKFL